MSLTTLAGDDVTELKWDAVPPSSVGDAVVPTEIKYYKNRKEMEISFEDKDVLLKGVLANRLVLEAEGESYFLG